MQTFDITREMYVAMATDIYEWLDTDKNWQEVITSTLELGNAVVELTASLYIHWRKERDYDFTRDILEDCQPLWWEIHTWVEDKDGDLVEVSNNGSFKEIQQLLLTD